MQDKRPMVPMVYRRDLVDHELFLRLRRSRAFIAEHVTEPIQLADLAYEACFSRFHYQRQFSRAFGETPHEFLTRMRIEHAKKLLRTSDMSVSEICMEVGYQSLGSFSSLFAKREGCAPSEFRRVFTFPGLWTRRVIPACMGRMYAAWPG
jgi:AraC-like DNA-binding protein